MTRLSRPTRRRFLLNTSMLAGGWQLTDAGLTQDRTPTPSCHDGDEPTVRQTEGPFFKPKSPERSNLRESGTKGNQFELSGLVLTRNCRAIGGALVDLWHADEKGEYDNIGFRYRGHVITGVPLSHYRASNLPRPHAALPCQGSGAGQQSADHAALFSQRASEPP